MRLPAGVRLPAAAACYAAAAAAMHGDSAAAATRAGSRGLSRVYAGAMHVQTECTGPLGACVLHARRLPSSARRPAAGAHG